MLGCIKWQVWTLTNWNSFALSSNLPNHLTKWSSSHIVQNCFLFLTQCDISKCIHRKIRYKTKPMHMCSWEKASTHMAHVIKGVLLHAKIVNAYTKFNQYWLCSSMYHFLINEHNDCINGMPLLLPPISTPGWPPGLHNSLKIIERSTIAQNTGRHIPGPFWGAPYFGGNCMKQ